MLFKKPYLFTLFASTVCAVTLFAGTVSFAQAASLTSGQIDAIVNLLQVFGADSGIIANVQAVLLGNPTTLATSSNQGLDTATTSNISSIANSSACPVISSNLQLGSNGEDVSQLQHFLSKDHTIYPEGLITGFFGNATLAAVQRWQAANGVVATGTPQDNGFGYVGPRTRDAMSKEMEAECETENRSTGGDQNISASSSESNSGDHATSSDGSVNKSDN